ncbi:MAG: GAF domain-containing protein [Methanoregula sp.]|nr:GAF domain-containing protein [Methanoregula sp.]
MITALYVDDESALLEIGKIFLERAGGIHIDTVTSAQDALKIIRATPYDAIISDYQMPVMDGIQFLKVVRTEYPALPFIMFTGKGREDVVIEALNNGADYYIQKGGDLKSQFAELVHTLQRSVEHKRAIETILHLNRLYSVLSRTNKAMIQIRDRQELLNEACRIAVEEGKFLMAWIGMIDPATHQVHPIAACGYEEGYLSSLSVSIDNVPQGMGLTGTAIREGHPTISNDIQSDPRMEHYRQEAAKRGYRSSAGIPIRTGKKIVGAMRFYAAECNFFSEKEMQLLQELVDDISFALELMEKRD